MDTDGMAGAREISNHEYTNWNNLGSFRGPASRALLGAGVKPRLSFDQTLSDEAEAARGSLKRYSRLASTDLFDADPWGSRGPGRMPWSASHGTAACVSGRTSDAFSSATFVETCAALIT